MHASSLHSSSASTSQGRPVLRNGPLGAPLRPCAGLRSRRVHEHLVRAETELSSSPTRPNLPAQAPSMPAASTPVAPSAPKAATDFKGVTIEYQRAQAKEMVAYFKSLNEEKAIEDAKVFGWTPANEITNGRWVMMGFGIGMLTEYATGVDFIHQLQLMISYLGILDLD